MAYLALVRHGQSVWNLQNRFTGWIDVPLSPHGEEEAHQAASLLSDIKFDVAFTSTLTRAQQTLDIILSDIGQTAIPQFKDCAINERHYGALQGMNKDEMRKKYGEEQVHLWRRSYDVRPPNGECLADTASRALPFYKEFIAPQLKSSNNVIVSAHGNSLRAIVMSLDGLNKEQVLALEVPTGVPHIYEFDSSMRILAKEILRNG